MMDTDKIINILLIQLIEISYLRLEDEILGKKYFGFSSQQIK